MLRAAETRSAWADAAAVVGLKTIATVALLLSGFRALSDDDFARVVLAERFAQAPALDPTGSSWLPFPFYVYGGALAAFGSSLSVARALAIALGIASSLLVWAAARVLGLSRRAALTGAAVGALLPSFARLGVATVPEAPTAALCVFGAACLGSWAKLRLAGALALFIACGSRYEAWGVAFAYAVVTAWDAVRERDKRLALAAGLALAFPGLWLLHGIFRHDDATFFVTRVAAYRSALGPDVDVLERLVRAPFGFFVGEPELAFVAVALGLPLLGQLRRSFVERQPGARFALALATLLLLVLIGDLRGSAPTHHSERTLLALWLGSALLVGYALDRRLESSPTLPIARIGAVLALAVAFGALIRSARVPESFVDRRAEEEIGLLARQLDATPLAIDSSDFGYFAIQAALGSPERAYVLDEHDPRRPSAADRLQQSPQVLAQELRARGVRWLVTPQARVPLTRGIGAVRGGNAGFALVELR